MPQPTRLLGLVAGLALIAPALAGRPPLHAVVLGGGPTPENNQVAIESNVRYVLRLLPPKGSTTVLFADGNRATKSVQFEKAPAESISQGKSVAYRVFAEGGAGVVTTAIAYRAPELPRLDGALSREAIREAVDRARAAGRKTPLLLYFTGHGSPNAKDFDNNWMDLWNLDRLTVEDLKAELLRLDPRQPVTLVMVQCFSGAFARLIADPELANRPICGFFAAPKSRPAAGCTPSIRETDYRDFSSYFFAALTGSDRLGRAVPRADYNKDGKVGGDEALAYAQIEDESIDVPQSTSEEFLMRALEIAPDDYLPRALPDVLRTASPLQHRTIEGLRQKIGELATGDDCLSKIAAWVKANPDDGLSLPMSLDPAERTRYEAALKTLRERFPKLGATTAETLPGALQEVGDYLDAQPELRSALARYFEKYSEAMAKAEAENARRARLLRLLRLCRSVTLESRLREGKSRVQIRELERLKKREAQPVLS